VGRWQRKLEEEDLNVSLNLKGSDQSAAFPVIYSELFFPQGTLLKEVMSAIHNPQYRTKWDPTVESGLVLDIVQDSKVLLWQQTN